MKTIEYCIMKWAGLGFRLIKVNGHHPSRNRPAGEDSYKWSKHPAEKHWNDPTVPGTSPDEAITWAQEASSACWCQTEPW